MKFIKIIYPIILLLICQINAVLGQKKKIDSNAYTKWSSVGGASISGNGKYVVYSIENESLRSQSVVVQSTENSWKRSFKLSSNLHLLSNRGRDYAIFINQKDSLVIVSLGKDLIRYIPSVSSFSVSQNEEGGWIAYQLKRSSRELIFQNLNTEKKHTYSDVVYSIIGDNGQVAILKTERRVEDKIIEGLIWVDLNTEKHTLIWEGPKASNIVLDVKYNQLAFICERSIYHYKREMNKLTCLVDPQTNNIYPELKLGGVKRFSNDGDRLFIDLKEEDKQKQKSGIVEVWSYLDSKLQPQQVNEIGARIYAAVVNLMDGKIIRLEQEHEYLTSNFFSKSSEKLSDEIQILYHDGSGRDGAGWGKVCDLISLKSGKRNPLKYHPEGLSPSGKYLVYFDTEQHTIVSYNVNSATSHTISSMFSESEHGEGMKRSGIAGWLDNDDGVFFYDNYDIWRLDLSGQKAPVNLTAGYGRRHNLVFSIVDGPYDPLPIRKSKKIILTAFNLKSKQNGFYSLELDRVKAPELLSMGDYIYSVPLGVQAEMEHIGFTPVRAKKTGVYLVNRMSAKEAPNYFSTRDFKVFKALSNVYPEREFEWYTTELHTWTSLDGRILQGVLYKPENFDPTKKYPVIFHYYEGKSNNLNAYLKPNVLCSGCNIDIPTYVNNGYLVFTPDIIYRIGNPMQGTYDAVVSAAKYIGALSYVDEKKMGIQGCSWGGIQTNYLLTHTNLFAAACTASGIADWVSNYGRLDGFGGGANLGMYEMGQFRMGSSIWEIPDAYIKNSPIFQLDKVTTPILIMHTKKDGRCSFDDAIELFTGLRRLGKKSWMLAYSEGNHGVFGKEAQDFSTRMMQFFDHYLKDKSAPVWMTTPIPAERRGLDDGLAYDTKIRTPGPGLLTTDEQRKVDSLMIRKPITITFR